MDFCIPTLMEIYHIEHRGGCQDTEPCLNSRRVFVCKLVASHKRVSGVKLINYTVFTLSDQQLQH